MYTVRSILVQIVRRKKLLLFLVAIIAGIALYGWYTDNIVLASFSTKYKPISPIIAATLIALSIFIHLDSGFEKSRLTKITTSLFLNISAFFYFIVILSFVFNFTQVFENSFVKNPDKFGTYLTGHMSPIAAIMFFAVSISLLLFRQNHSDIFKYIGGVISLLVLLLSSVLLIAYLFNAPLLFGREVLPVALPVASSFFLLSFTLLRIYELKFWTFNLIKENTLGLRLLKVFLPIVVFALTAQGLLITSISIKGKNPTLSIALILLIVVGLIIILAVKVSVDIGNKLQRAEQAVKDSEERFSRAIRYAPVPIMIHSENGRVLAISDGWTEKSGYTLEDIPTIDKWTEQAYASRKENIKEEIDALYKMKGSKHEGEYIIRCKDNTSGVWDFSSAFLGNFDPDGRVVISIAKDVTERKHSEELLSKQNNLLNTLLDNLQIGVFMVEVPSGNPLLENEASYKLLGREILPEVHSTTISKIYDLYKSESNVPYPNEELPLVVAMGGISKHVDDMYVVKPDGTKTDLEVFGSPVLDDKGNIWASLVSFQDITQRKQAESALKESEKEFRSLAESMPQIVWTTRADGWNTYFNQQWVDYTGLSIEESSGHGWNLPFHPEDKQRAWDAWQNAVNNNAEYSIESRLRCHDGTYRWWLIRGVPQISAGGEIVKFFGTCTDIQKIKEAELALKESEKLLLRLNADKNRFISILGHDLKSPFNNILGLSEILIEEIRSLNTDETESIAKNINKSARITNKLLEDILMWSRTQQGSIAYKPQNLSLSKTCRNILEILNPIAYSKNIKIYSSVGNIYVYADIDMIKTILLNLISNAIKFTNSGGSINIKAEQNSENVIISVSDNGVGIPLDNLSKLFDISQVLSTKGTAGETGTGLGLLLCKEFVEKHGGKIWVDSEEGKGSDFKFTLQSATEQASKAT